MNFQLRLPLFILFLFLFIPPIQHAHAQNFAWGRTTKGVDLCFPADTTGPRQGQPTLDSTAVGDEYCHPIFTWGQFTFEQHPTTGAWVSKPDHTAPWGCYYTNADTDRILAGRLPLHEEEETEFCGQRQYIWAPSSQGGDRCYLAYSDPTHTPVQAIRPLKKRPPVDLADEANTCGIEYEWGDENNDQNWRCYAIHPKTKHALLAAIQVDETTKKQTLVFRSPVAEGCSKRKPKRHNASLFDPNPTAERDPHPDPITSTTVGKVYFNWGTARDGAEYCYQSTHSKRRHPYINTAAVADEYCTVRYLWGQDRKSQWRCYVTKDSGVPLEQREPIDERYCTRSYAGQAWQFLKGLFPAVF